MNNKGQVLVLFVLLLPILIVLVALMIDTGMSYMEKRKIEQVMQDTISYALDHLGEEEASLKINMSYLLNQNIDDIYEMKIDINNQSVTIGLEKKINTIFSSVITPQRTIKLRYKGSFIDDKKEIKKVG